MSEFGLYDSTSSYIGDNLHFKGLAYYESYAFLAQSLAEVFSSRA